MGIDSKLIGINSPVVDIKNIINKMVINVRAIEFKFKSPIRIPDIEQ